MIVNEFIQYEVYLEEDDQCVDCKNKYGCPLIEALASGVVKMDSEDSLHIEDCIHYVEGSEA